MSEYGKILKITETVEKVGLIIKEEPMEGFTIETENSFIYCMIESGNFCCEEFGYSFLSTPDDLKDYVGAQVNSVKILEIKDGSRHDVDLEEKINIETDKGTLQFSVYQRHNGYYGHDTKVEIEWKRG